MTDQDDVFIIDAIRNRMQGKLLDCNACKHFTTSPMRPWCKLQKEPPRQIEDRFICPLFELGRPNGPA